MSIAAVPTWSTPLTTDASPRTVTTAGSTVTRESQYPAATDPRTAGTTGTVRVVAVGRTGTVTWTTAGSTVSPSIVLPLASTATGCTLCTRSVTASPNSTVA